MTRRFRLVLSGSCALLAALLCVLYGQGTREEAERARAEALERYGGEVVSLVVATEGLEAGDVVDYDNVEERDWLADLAPEGAVTGIDSVIGAEVSVPVAAGVPLTSLNFREGRSAVEVPEGRVALSVPVSDALGLPPATEVGAVLAGYEVSATGVNLIADDLQVLLVSNERTGLVASGSLTVAVQPGDVAWVLSASGQGTLRLALPADGALLSEEAPTGPTSVEAEDGTSAEGEAPAEGVAPAEGLDAGVAEGGEGA